MSMLVFDITQFFPLLNYQLFLLILDKADFDSKISFFFSSYLIGSKTQYLQNNYISPLFSINISVEQSSTLSSILSILYISPILHIFEKGIKNLNISVLFLSFLDNSIFISQEKSFEKTNAFLFCSYNIISFLFNQFGLVTKHRKSEVFYFSRLHRNFNFSLLNFSILEGLIL